MLELSEEENDPSLLTEIKSSLTDLDDQVTEAEFKALLSEKNDFSNAFVAINSGAGGTESQDWADMLLRMYLRWSDRNGFKAEVLDTQYGEEAGIKSATVLLSGDYVFGYLKAEMGVHRLVRISPFDSNKRRHTSFASVFIVVLQESSCLSAIDLIDGFTTVGKITHPRQFIRSYVD